MNRLLAMLHGLRSRFCSEAIRRADQALAAAALQREQRRNAVETSRSSNRLMNDALQKLHDALRGTVQ